jgi:hypothetical protein
MKINLFQSEFDWLEYKKGKVSASPMHRLLTKGKTFGLSVGAETYVEELFASTIADDIIEPYLSIEMQHGKDEEPVGIEELGKLYPFNRIDHFGGNQFMFCDYNDFSGCSPDALISDDSGKYILGAEVKCPTSKVKHIERLLNVKDGKSLNAHDSSIYAQIQFNMMCFDLPEWLFVSYYSYMHDRAARLVVVKIEADKDFQELIKGKLIEAKEHFDSLKSKYNQTIKHLK